MRKSKTGLFDDLETAPAVASAPAVPAAPQSRTGLFDDLAAAPAASPQKQVRTPKISPDELAKYRPLFERRRQVADQLSNGRPGETAGANAQLGDIDTYLYSRVKITQLKRDMRGKGRDKYRDRDEMRTLLMRGSAAAERLGMKVEAAELDKVLFSPELRVSNQAYDAGYTISQLTPDEADEMERIRTKAERAAEAERKRKLEGKIKETPAPLRGVARWALDLPNSDNRAARFVGNALQGAESIDVGLAGAAEALGLPGGKGLSDMMQSQQEATQLARTKELDLLDQIAQGVGSSVPFFFVGGSLGAAAKATELFSPTMARAIAAGGSAAAEATTNAGSTYASLVRSGVSQEEARMRAGRQFVTDAVLGTILNKYGEFAGPELQGIKRALMAAPSEAIESIQQQISQNVANKRPWDEGLSESAIVGGAVGGVLGGAGAVVQKAANSRSVLVDAPKKMDDALLREISGKGRTLVSGPLEAPVAPVPTSPAPVAATPSLASLLAPVVPGPLTNASRRTRPAGYLDNPNARTSGELPVVLGQGEEAPANVLLPNGEPLFRNDADRARLAAMVEEFGPEAGRGRFVDDRVSMAPQAAPAPNLITGTETSRSEIDAITKRLARLKADRAGLDEIPNLPPNARESMVRTLDPDGDQFDPFSDTYDDDLAATAYRVLFGDVAPRGRDGDVSEAALSDLRQELRTEQNAAYFRETLAGEQANPEDADHVRDLGLRSKAVRDPETTKDYIPDVDERDIPDSSEDWITAKRANNRRGWKVNGRRINMVGMEGVHPETARAIIAHALSKESDGFFLRRSEYQKYQRAKVKPKMRKLSEIIEMEVGDAWKEGDFDGWSRIQIPRSVVAEYVRNRMAETATAQEVLKSIAPTLSAQELQDVVEHYARGGESPAGSGAGDGGAADGGRPDAQSGIRIEGDRGSGRPKSPREPDRARLDAEIASLEDRIARARVVDDAPSKILRPGQPDDGPAPTILGPDGRPTEKPPTKRERSKAREQARTKTATVAQPALSIEAAPSTPVVERSRPTKKEEAPKPKAAADAEKPAPSPRRESSDSQAEPTVETRNADTEREREEAGTAPVERQEYTTKRQADEAGEKAVKRGRDHVALAERIATDPRPITAVENGVLKAGRRRLLNDAKAAVDRRRAAQAKGDFEEAGEHHQEYLRVRALIDRNTEALVKGGRELSAAFGARRGESAVDLTDAEAVVSEARWMAGDGNKPGEINARAEARLRKMAEDLAAMERKAGDERKAREKAEAALGRLKEERTARARKREDLKGEMSDLSKQLTKSLTGTMNSGLPVEAVAILGKMARNAVHQGALTLADVIASVRSNLPEDLADNIEDRDILDALSGYAGTPEAKARTAVQSRIDELKRLARLASEIEDAAAGHRKPAKARPSPSDEVAKLRKVRDELRKEKGLDPRTSRVLKSVSELVAALEKRTAEVEAATARGKELPKVPRSVEVAVEAAQARLRTAIAKNRAHATIRDLERQPATGKFDEPKGRPLPDAEMQELNFRRAELRRQIRGAIEAQKPKSFGKKAGGFVMEVAGVIRMFKTSWDLSAALRQGGMLSLANPKQAARAFGEQIKALRDPAYAHAANESLLRGPRAKAYAEAGLYLSDPEADNLSNHEEAFLSKWAGKLPGIRASERAYTAYLNTIRAEVFDKLTTGVELSIEDRKAVANYINVATGRGGLGGFEKAGNAMAAFLFSPRYLTSRFQVIVGQPLWGGSAKSRAIVAKEYGKYVGAILAVVAVAKAFGAAVSLEPEDPDFLKVRIGDSRLDMLSGLAQALRFTIRMGTGKSDRERTAKQFLRSKLSPAAGYTWTLATGKDFLGKEAGVKDVASDAIWPMLPKDTYEAVKSQGVPGGLALGVLSALGIGVQTYKK